MVTSPTQLVSTLVITKSAAAHGVEISRDEAPQHNVDRDPRDHWKQPHRAAAQQIEFSQYDAGDGAHLHVAAPFGSIKGSRAVLLREGSRVAFEKNLAVRQQEHSIAHRLDLEHIVRSP